MSNDESDPESRAGTGDVLLVDDNDLDAERLSRALARLGVGRRTLRARDGLDALERLDGLPAQATPALMVVDFDMPRMNGRELLDACAARPRFASVPRLLMSSSLRTLERDAADNAGASPGGADDVERVVKPATLADTVAAVARCAAVAPLVSRHDIVLVDDDPDVHELARRLVRREPRRLLSLVGSDAARRALPGTEVELLIVDARMPDGDGLDLLEGLHAAGTVRARRTLLSSAGRLASAEAARATALGLEVVDKRELFDRHRFGSNIGEAPAKAA